MRGATEQTRCLKCGAVDVLRDAIAALSPCEGSRDVLGTLLHELRCRPWVCGRCANELVGEDRYDRDAIVQFEGDEP